MGRSPTAPGLGARRAREGQAGAGAAAHLCHPHAGGRGAAALPASPPRPRAPAASRDRSRPPLLPVCRCPSAWQLPPAPGRWRGLTRGSPSLRRGGGGAAHGHPSSPGLARRCRARAAQLLGGSPVRFAPRRPGGHGLIAASRSWLAFPPCLCLHAMDWTVFPAPKSMCPNPAPCVMHVELESWGSEWPDEGGVFVAR